MSIHTYTHKHICTHIHTFTYTYIRTYAYTYAHKHAYVLWSQNLVILTVWCGIDNKNMTKFYSIIIFHIQYSNVRLNALYIYIVSM